MGIKGKAVSIAVRLLAKKVRQGTWHMRKIISYLDDDAARLFAKHSGAIANKLDDIAKIPDLVTHVVRQKLFHYLTLELGMSGGAALQIADAVGAVLWVLL